MAKKIWEYAELGVNWPAGDAWGAAAYNAKVYQDELKTIKEVTRRDREAEKGERQSERGKGQNPKGE